MDILRDIMIGIFIFLYATHLRSSRRSWPCHQALLRCMAFPVEVAALGASAVHKAPRVFLYAGRNQLRARVYLFSKDLFHVAHFPLHFSADLFCGAAVLQILVPDRLAGFLFDFADSFFCRTFYFIVCA